jgi:hypothetical protein
MAVYCCTKYDDNANLKFSYCSSNFPCPPGWIQTLVNVCTACPVVGDRDELLAEIEQDQPGSSQYAVLG